MGLPWGGRGRPLPGSLVGSCVPRSVFVPSPPRSPLGAYPALRCLSALWSGGSVSLRRGRFLFSGCGLNCSHTDCVGSPREALCAPASAFRGLTASLSSSWCGYKAVTFSHITPWLSPGRKSGPPRRICGAINSPEIVNHRSGSKCKRHF